MTTTCTAKGYAAIDNGDGTFDILDVPILGEMRKGDKGAHADLGRDWLERVLDNHRKLAVHHNHFKPIHVLHHDIGIKPEAAGRLLPVSVKEIDYLGKPMWCLHADLKRVPSHIKETIERGMLPYVSVEVRSWKDAMLSSLALMDTDDPYFQFPMLGIAATHKRDEFIAHDRMEGPAMASLRMGDTGSILLSFGGNKMADDKKIDDKDEVAEKPALEAAPEADATAPEAGKPETPEAEKPADGSSLKAIGDQVSALTVAVQSMLKALGQLVSGLGQPIGGQPSPAPVDQAAPALAGAPGGMSPRLAAKDAAVIDDLQARVAKMEHDKKLEAMMIGARAKLAAWKLSEQTQAKLRGFAEADASGKLLDAFVEEYAASVPKDPPRSIGEYEGAHMAADPEEVLAYASAGPEKLSGAREAYLLWKEAKAKGHTDATAKRFIEIQLGFLDGTLQSAGRR